jgi:hypothetical protein
MQSWNQRTKKLPKAKAEPREMNDINLDYTQSCAELGLKQFTIKELEMEVASLYIKIAGLKDEGKRRGLVDAKKRVQEKQLEDAKAGLQQAGG